MVPDEVQAKKWAAENGAGELTMEQLVVNKDLRKFILDEVSLPA